MLWYFSLINVPRCYILCNVQQTFKLGGCQDKHKSINKYFGFNGLSYKLLLHLAINILTLQPIKCSTLVTANSSLRYFENVQVSEITKFSQI